MTLVYDNSRIDRQIHDDQLLYLGAGRDWNKQNFFGATSFL
jgi:hypothetical protein